VRVKAQDIHGDEFECELEGMHAVCLQHELDHLNGILFVDHVSKLRALRFRKTLKTLEQQASTNQQSTASVCNPS
jgi:peptide deformylase